MLKDLQGLKPPASRSLWFLRAQRDALFEYIIEEAATPFEEDEARSFLEKVCTHWNASLTTKESQRYFNSRMQPETVEAIHTFRSLCKLISQLEREEYERLMRLSTLNLAPT